MSSKSVHSEHAARFDHDDDAPRYDADVRREEHPIRAGYDAVLAWVAAQVPTGCAVVDLGIGTGNLAARLAPEVAVVGVDVSREMLARAAAKLEGRPVELVRADLLAWATGSDAPVEAAISTYAVHHLTNDEKDVLLRALAARLRPGAVMAFGDLMFADAAGEQEQRARFADRPEVVEAFDDEFFWDLARARHTLDDLGLSTTVQRFSALSWGLAARAR